MVIATFGDQPLKFWYAIFDDRLLKLLVLTIAIFHIRIYGHWRIILKKNQKLSVRKKKKIHYSKIIWKTPINTKSDIDKSESLIILLYKRISCITILIFTPSVISLFVLQVVTPISSSWNYCLTWRHGNLLIFIPY